MTDPTLPSLLVQAFDVALFADVERAIAMYFNEIAMRHDLPSQFAFGTKRRDEGAQGDATGFQHQFGDFSDAADILLPVLIAKAQVAAKTVPYIVAIEHESSASQLMQAFFDRMCQGRFAGSGQTGKP